MSRKHLLYADLVIAWIFQEFQVTENRLTTKLNDPLYTFQRI